MITKNNVIRKNLNNWQQMNVVKFRKLCTIEFHYTEDYKCKFLINNPCNSFHIK